MRRYGLAVAARLIVVVLATLLGTWTLASLPGPVEPTPGVDEAAAAEAPCVPPPPVEALAAAVLVVGLPGVTTADDPLVAELAALGVGGIVLEDGNVVDAAQARALVDGVRARAPFGVLVVADEEGGRVSTTDALGARTPSARRLGEDGPEAARMAGRSVGTRLARLGVDAALAPVADVDGGPADGVIGDRSFSGDPDVAADAAVAFSAGLADVGLLRTAKHFPGHGGTADTHTAPVVVDDIGPGALVPFEALVDEGVELVMLAHVGYRSLGDGGPASLEPAAYELLRDTGFDGVAITDDLGMAAVARPLPEAVVDALAAGADAALFVDGTAAVGVRDAVVAAVRDGRLSAARLVDAVLHVLAARGIEPTGRTCVDERP